MDPQIKGAQENPIKINIENNMKSPYNQFSKPLVKRDLKAQNKIDIIYKRTKTHRNCTEQKMMQVPLQMLKIKNIPARKPMYSISIHTAQNVN